MCSIVGGLVFSERMHNVLMRAWCEAASRGRDGSGYVQLAMDGEVHLDFPEWCPSLPAGELVLGHHRAAPTNENRATPEKARQPMEVDGTWLIHNGTVANDHDLRTYQCPQQVDSAALVELLAPLRHLTAPGVAEALSSVQGSYALAVARPEEGALVLAANWKPLYYTVSDSGEMVFASEASMLESEDNNWRIRSVGPYEVQKFAYTGRGVQPVGYPVGTAPYTGVGRVAVVHSGGMDSTVAATFLHRQGYGVTLVHVRYGCHAQERELEAVKGVADYLGVDYCVLDLGTVFEGVSALTRPVDALAGGVESSEWAHEWVPARNLVLMAHVVAWAEANGYDHVALGTNLEEAGNHPDNEPEFINRMNAALPYATHPESCVTLLNPVGRYMKHEIAYYGEKEGAPLHLSWSCYHGREKPCGQCGSCYKRQQAYRMAGMVDPQEYEQPWEG